MFQFMFVFLATGVTLVGAALYCLSLFHVVWTFDNSKINGAYIAVILTLVHIVCAWCIVKGMNESILNSFGSIETASLGVWASLVSTYIVPISLVQLIIFKALSGHKLVASGVN